MRVGSGYHIILAQSYHIILISLTISSLLRRAQALLRPCDSIPTHLASNRPRLLLHFSLKQAKAAPTQVLGL